ncbi:GerMN domain-containing protein [Haliovirga abyssi]|uniref:GerMN domain-containing protein n=1 Tax=Haliovirga abyssi TaxID=2996794 RepID=A0AAU9D9T6_9FUSO|nr:GerMN domain-containing protein [Haliovirga abyssi]BDU50080.1 hypothetical protein HLVA_06490 [Haliovirga abyssi]
MKKAILIIFLVLDIIMFFLYYKYYIKTPEIIKYNAKTVSNIEKNKKETMKIYIPDDKYKYLKGIDVEIPYYKDKEKKIKAILEKILPFEVKVLNIYIEKENLYINLNSKFKEIVNDSEKELYIVYSIVNTVTQVENIKKVKILIDNEEIKTVTGYLNYNKFFKQDDLLIEGE